MEKLDLRNPVLPASSASMSLRKKYIGKIETPFSNQQTQKSSEVISTDHDTIVARKSSTN